MGWIPDHVDTLVLELTEELRDVGAFCCHWNGPAQRAFAEHIQAIGKPVDLLTVADLKAAAAHSDQVCRQLIAGGLA